VSDITDGDRSALLALARSAIEAELMEKKVPLRPKDPGPALLEKRGCFITLHKGGALRGCIGCIEPETSLVKGVEENALNAAFRDPRFPPVSAEELPEIQIEVSVLTLPKPLSFTDGEDLKAKLIPDVHGVILSRGWQRSTFLPQVWKQLPRKEAFLGNLCRKAGMEKDCWKDKNTTVKVYQAEYFSETD